MSKTVAGWFRRTRSNSLSKDINKQSAQGSEQEEDKENNSEKLLTKCESLPTSLLCMESDDDESQADQEGPCVEFNEKELGSLVSLKEQLEKVKEDESLRRWQVQLLGVAREDSPDSFVMRILDVDL
ncbi:uncharacterized protein [Physcomitrium patens]|uniref:Uncharacterized protein n=1 Tax=Physcomitrium patens TaxID=3218 RepID=A0A2K1IM70_PHYPA|nr:rho GDP-dissociation inhibitor 1-like [Physcomitrium patens]PNR30370.1 hypothetical protein PHYPA_026686 [Physcomitrium patens]|eukprot:XP_024360425.1 rho GDP-dissociation inhibitor 1-like [Physcomitrella patens]